VNLFPLASGNICNVNTCSRNMSSVNHINPQNHCICYETCLFSCRLFGHSICAGLFCAVSGISQTSLYVLKKAVEDNNLESLNQTSRKQRSNGFIKPLTETQQHIYDVLADVFGTYAEAMPHLSVRSDKKTSNENRDYEPVKYINKGLFNNRRELYECLVAAGDLDKDKHKLKMFYKIWNR
jgi:hypothetical protein